MSGAQGRSSAVHGICVHVGIVADCFACSTQSAPKLAQACAALCMPGSTGSIRKPLILGLITSNSAACSSIRSSCQEQVAGPIQVRNGVLNPAHPSLVCARCQCCKHPANPSGTAILQLQPAYPVLPQHKNAPGQMLVSCHYSRSWAATPILTAVLQACQGRMWSWQQPSALALQQWPWELSLTIP